MPRPKRILCPHTWYHIMNRGNGRKTMFFSEHHKYLFLKLLQWINTEYSIETHGYCLMKNHFHLLLFTKHNNLSDAFEGMFSTYACAISN